MKKLLIICPHLSTGGAPQVSVNKVQLIKNDFIIKIVEHDFLAWSFVVQRNRIIDLVGAENFHSLGEDKYSELKQVLEDFQPDVVSMEEFPEMFMQDKTAAYLYRKDRPYTILETTHDSSFDTNHKKFFPDKFVFVSPYSAFKYEHLDIPTEIIEYPIDKKEKNKSAFREKLGLDHGYKHIVIVGLFTPRKNQKYGFELAHKLSDYPVKFHFLGNQAGNFEFYWKPLMNWKASDSRLDNCTVWGERADIEDFMQAADMSLFCSKGERNNKELNPIAIKEALEYDMPHLMFNLDVYCNKYHEYENVSYLTGDIEEDAKKIIDCLSIKAQKKHEELIIVGTYPNLKERVRLTKECIKRIKPLGRKIMLVSHYPVDEETQRMVDFYVFDAHNPLTHQSYYNRFYNLTNFYDAEININGLKDSNQSLSVLTNLFNAFKESKNLGYKRAFYITFDYLIHEKDYEEIEKSLEIVSKNQGAYLGTLETPFGHGIQTNGMTFDVEYFLRTFDDVRTPQEYNRICEEYKCQNFLEDYMINVLRRDSHENKFHLVTNERQTFLINTGSEGASSNSEYYSILPIEGTEDEYMFYFFSYNVDERFVNISISEEGNEFFNTRFQIRKHREYKKDFKYSGKPMQFCIEFLDGDYCYKKETYEINESTLNKFKNTGKFKWKNRKPKIKLVHIQVTKDDERQEKSRHSMQTVRDFGWEYVLHTNVPYGDLPPKYNCVRPDCVSMVLFDEDTVNRVGTALTPSHYGCYEAFKNAILSEFTNDIDFLMVCEGDCIIEVSTEEFVNKVEKCCEIVNDNNVGYMSFGDKETLEHGWLQSPVREEIPNQDSMYITDHIIGLQSILFPKKVSGYLKEQLRTHKWDAADMYFNIIMGASGYKFGIVYNRLTTQADGFSLIDNTIKTFIKK